ncbi:spore germination protein (plasmid) [Cytobacillus solani]|uniref:spore germination protein n=1 Tax=Cytobacillus solani TaxID=1637975 RepID=UPI00207A167C|nr:spore germination protein [Cytobacillus solani]USK57743.1 spore germination protein [Cytobacillus solani]
MKEGRVVLNISSKDKITTSQAVVFLINFIVATGILTLPRTSVEKVKTPDVWITAIISGLIMVIIGIIIVKLSQHFPGKTFYQYSQEILGKWVGWFLSLLIILYFIVAASFQVRSMAEVTSIFLLEGTPTWAIIMPFMWISLYLITGGVNSIARLFEIIFPITIFFFLLVLFLSFKLFELKNLRPVLGFGVMPVLKGIQATTLAYTGPEIVLILVAFLKQPNKAVKVILIGTLIPMIFYVLTVIMVIGALSIDGVVTRTWPTLELIRSFEIPGLFFERFESFLLGIWIMQMFATYTVSFFAAALGLAQLFQKKMNKSLYILLPVIYLISMAPKTINDLFKIGDLIGQAMWVLFGIMPLLLLLIIKLRGGKT